MPAKRLRRSAGPTMKGMLPTIGSLGGPGGKFSGFLKRLPLFSLVN
jgi:hypothetical protein